MTGQSFRRPSRLRVAQITARRSRSPDVQPTPVVASAASSLAASRSSSGATSPPRPGSSTPLSVSYAFVAFSARCAMLNVPFGEYAAKWPGTGVTDKLSADREVGDDMP